MVSKPPLPPMPPATPKSNDPEALHWCGHKIKDHDGPDGMCKYNTEALDSCDCGGLDK